MIIIRLFLFFAVPVIVLTSCATNRSVLGHKGEQHKKISDDLVPDRDFSLLRERYACAKLEGERVYYRNVIVRRLMLIEDERFAAMSQQLFGGRTAINTTADFATGFGSALLAAGKVASTQNVALAIAGANVGRNALNKNVFLEQRAGALVNVMEAARSRVDTQITQYLRKPCSEYTLEEGYRDFKKYCAAGSLVTADTQLAAEAKKAAIIAEATNAIEKGDKVVAPAVIAALAAEAKAREKRIENAMDIPIGRPTKGPGDDIPVTKKSSELRRKYNAASDGFAEAMKLKTDFKKDNDTIKKIFKDEEVPDIYKPSMNGMRGYFEVMPVSKVEDFIKTIIDATPKPEIDATP